MLGFITRFGSSKGMVRVPNLDGLTMEQADSLLSSVGLLRSGRTSSATSNNARNEKINTQSIAANSLVDYETSISYNYEYYVPPYQPTITKDPTCSTYSSTTKAGSCNPDKSWNYPVTTSQQRRGVYYDGVLSYYESCQDVISGGGSDFVDGLCGFVEKPVAACINTADNYFVVVPWSACSGGTRTRTVGSRDIYCNETRTKETEDCCTAGLRFCDGSWTPTSGGSYRTCYYRRADCSTYTEIETRCTVKTTTSCTSCSTKKPFRKTCTTTTTSSDCSQSSSSASQAC
jgi:hypothetical protein